jgi:two-component system nitrogen regulation response regulator GlnG
MDTLHHEIVQLSEAFFSQKSGILYKSLLDVVEKPLIETTLRRTRGNQIRAAAVLGINRNTLRTKIKRLNIDPELYKE